jgi:vacuolar-type H+-ATPase subunit H
MSDYDDLHQQRGIERIAALIDNAKSFSLKSAFSNLLNEEWVAGKLEKTLLQTAEKLTPQALIDDVNLWAGGKIPFGEVVSNLAVNTLKRVDDGLNRGSIATASMSIAGTAMSALGIKQGETVSDIGTVGGAIVDAGSMLTGAAKLFQAAKTGFYPTAGTLGKVAGALAIPIGLFVGFTEGAAAIKDYQQNGQLTNDGKASAWNSAGGFLTAAGGVALLIPGGQIVGGILLAAGGVCSGVSWYFQNKEKVDAFVKNTWTSASTAVSKAMTDVKNTVNKAVTAVKETVKKTIDTARTKIADTVTKVTDTAAKAITSAGENISKAVTKVTETTAKVVKVVGEKVAAAVTKVTETVSKAVTNTASAAAKLVSKVSPAAAEKIVQAGQTVSKAVSSAGQTVAKTVTKVTETTSKAISNAGQAVSKTVNTVTQKAASTVKSIGNTISNWFKPKP